MPHPEPKVALSIQELEAGMRALLPETKRLIEDLEQTTNVDPDFFLLTFDR